MLMSVLHASVAELINSRRLSCRESRVTDPWEGDLPDSIWKNGSTAAHQCATDAKLQNVYRVQGLIVCVRSKPLAQNLKYLVLALVGF